MTGRHAAEADQDTAVILTGWRLGMATPLPRRPGDLLVCPWCRSPRNATSYRDRAYCGGCDREWAVQPEPVPAPRAEGDAPESDPERDRYIARRRLDEWATGRPAPGQP